MPISLVKRQRKEKPLRLVMLLDASGSMSMYTGMFLRFIHGVLDEFREAEAFLFHTRLAHGVDVSCDDGRRGIFSGDAIVWADGTRSSLASPHPSVIVGNKSSVVVGQGVFVGQGKGVVPMENPSDPRRARCPVLDGVSYCY